MADRILVVQHGEKERRPGDPGLTPLGHQQATATARWLASDAHVVAVASSPLRRAVETAAPIAQEVGTEVLIDDRLRERMNWHGADGEDLDEFLAVGVPACAVTRLRRSDRWHVELPSTVHLGDRQTP